MGDLFRVQYIGRALVLGLMALGLLTATGPTATGQAVGPDRAVLADFQKRLDGYLRLRGDLARQLKPLSPTASASDLAARQESLAAALKVRRETARPGDLIPPPMGGMLRAIVAADLKERSTAARRGALAEVPAVARPVINKTYPPEAALPTVPPLLLKKLPPLPDNLQYRFYGRDLVILDGDVEIIVDYVPDVLPPH